MMKLELEGWIEMVNFNVTQFFNAYFTSNDPVQTAEDTFNQGIAVTPWFDLY